MTFFCRRFSTLPVRGARSGRAIPQRDVTPAALCAAQTCPINADTFRPEAPKKGGGFGSKSVLSFGEHRPIE